VPVAGHPGAELALARYEADPQAGQAPLKQELLLGGIDRPGVGMVTSPAP
jgi:hypothetical protein